MIDMCKVGDLFPDNFLEAVTKHIVKIHRLTVRINGGLRRSGKSIRLEHPPLTMDSKPGERRISVERDIDKTKYNGESINAVRCVAARKSELRGLFKSVVCRPIVVFYELIYKPAERHRNIVGTGVIESEIDIRKPQICSTLVEAATELRSKLESILNNVPDERIYVYSSAIRN